MKLLIELVPKNCWNSNVRSTVTTKQWDIIRFLSYKEANYKCEICKKTGKAQGYRHDIECHEIWEYDDINRIQILIGLISLCPLCHQVKHIGRATAIGKQAECFEQLQKINSWNHRQVVEHMAESFILQKERSKYQYTLDLSLLTHEPYNLEINSEKPRVYTKSKYRKKRKYKTKRKA